MDEENKWRVGSAPKVESKLGRKEDKFRILKMFVEEAFTWRILLGSFIERTPSNELK